MTNEEIELMTDKIYARTKNIPGIDRDFINKCLQGIALLNDNQVETKLKQLMRFL